MDKRDIIKTINDAIRNRTPYANNLAAVVNKMTQYQQDYFFNKVATYYLDGPGKDLYGGMYKDMEYMARAVANDRDVSSILGVDYRQIGAMSSSLPTIQHRQAHQQKPRTEAEITANINSLIDKYVLHTGAPVVGHSNSFFCQSANVDIDTMPVQGWKFHISANNLRDYEQLMEKLCPEFDALGIDFKVVRPEMLEQQINSQQIGKAITVYPSPAFDFRRLSPELRAILGQESLHPIGDAQIQGRIHARYGKFRGKDGHLIAPNGWTERDLKHERVAPSFVKEATAEQIFDFYNDCNRRYAETSDAKMYLQEMVTMTRGEQGSNAFVTLCTEDCDQSQLRKLLTWDTSGNSFVYNLNGQDYVILHSASANELLEILDGHGVNYTRPDWDQRYNVYAIHSSQYNEMKYVVDILNGQCASPNAPHTSIVEMDNGMIGIEVDTTQNGTFLSMCQDHKLSIGLVELNIDVHELRQKEQGYNWERQHVDGYDDVDFVR